LKKIDGIKFINSTSGYDTHSTFYFAVQVFFWFQKNAVPYGTSQIIYIDIQPAQTQGYVQDANNYQVWCTTRFSAHEVSLVFATTPNSTY
jgi:hypothetical protein